MEENKEVIQGNQEVIKEENKEEIKTFGLIDEAKKVREDLEKTIESMKREREKFERVMTENIIQGRSLAGASVQISEEEKAKQAAMKLLEGTGLNPFK